MKIVHYVESYTLHVRRLVESQKAGGHDVTVLTQQAKEAVGRVVEFPPGNLRKRMPYSHHWNGILSVRRTYSLLRPDIVHGHYLSTAALYLAVRNRCPAIGSAMGSDVLIDPSAFHARCLLKALPVWVDRFTSVSSHLTERMVKLGIPEDRISTFPWGVDEAVFYPNETAERKPTIVSTRSLERLYDIPTLLRAFHRVLQQEPTSSLRILGGGTQISNLEREAESLGINRNVIFLGQQSVQTIAHELRTARIYVSTSPSDGASVSLLEAMSTGTLPIVSNIDANRDWITHRDNGLLFRAGDDQSLADALLVALRDEELLHRSHTKNPTTVRTRASWSQSLETLDKLYRAVAE